jgi:DNA modification methylase
MNTIQQVIIADSHEWIKTQQENSFDHIITDPVYGEPFDLKEWRRICKGNILVFCKPEFQPFIADEYLFWIKTPSTKNYVKNCGRFVEMILVSRNGKTFNQLHWSQMTGVYTDLVIDRTGHQWRKPLTLLERLVRIYTNEGDNILDPFCGSGTTLLACKNLNRSCIGIEIDPIWGNYKE